MCFTTKYSYLLLVILCVLYHWEHSAPRRELHGPSAGCPGRRYGLGSWGLYHAHGLMAWYSASVCPGWGDPCSGALCSHELCRLSLWMLHMIFPHPALPWCSTIYSTFLWVCKNMGAGGCVCGWEAGQGEGGDGVGCFKMWYFIMYSYITCSVLHLKSPV